MAQFMLLVRGGGAMPQHFTPEQVQQALQRYFDWSDKLRSEGRYHDANELNDGGRTVRMRGGQAVVDGPYVETKEAIGGYYLIEAANEDEAAEIAKGCPVLGHGGLVDVREIAVH
ncbi:MAG: YciI family protein [Thermomicrobiales bacterium]